MRRLQFILDEPGDVLSLGLSRVILETHEDPGGRLEVGPERLLARHGENPVAMRRWSFGEAVRCARRNCFVLVPQCLALGAALWSITFTIALSATKRFKKPLSDDCA